MLTFTVYFLHTITLYKYVCVHLSEANLYGMYTTMYYRYCRGNTPCPTPLIAPTNTPLPVAVVSVDESSTDGPSSVCFDINPSNKELNPV